MQIYNIGGFKVKCILISYPNPIIQICKNAHFRKKWIYLKNIFSINYLEKYVKKLSEVLKKQR